MATYVNPRAADHCEGLEQRIIETSHRIDLLERASAATEGQLGELRAERRRLLDELVATTEAMTAEGLGSEVAVHARPVTEPGAAP